jgi:hypothetical protein
MPGLDPGIHHSSLESFSRWTAGPSPRRSGFGRAGGSSPATTKKVRRYPHYEGSGADKPHLMAFTHSSRIFTTPDIPGGATHSLTPCKRELSYAGERQSIRAHGLHRQCRG